MNRGSGNQEYIKQCPTRSQPDIRHRQTTRLTVRRRGMQGGFIQ
ncbi:hypothetical protein HMPREF3226_02669 [Prevotella corporis]|uniref:Uncharacterized protein n=1 Tax=Prevotella corporis TaxID=28128 RepID=A0A133PTL7_9BACT|nr:hypothetical protein HMPREF3226_02669 [Prevotella corporis]